MTASSGRIAAFFDIDHTVLEINSGSKWVRYQWRSGQMSLWGVARAIAWLVQYRFDLLDFQAMARKVLKGYAGKEVDPIARDVERWFQREVAWSICVQARERIAHHNEQGHVVALLTSATPFLSLPVAKAVEVDHILCTEVEVVDGVITGEPIEPMCYGKGKVVKAETFAAEHGVDLDRSYFYTDSYSDLPMLERVGEPRVVNPDPRLKRRAAECGWGHEMWTAEGSEPGDKTNGGEHVGSGSG